MSGNRFGGCKMERVCSQSQHSELYRAVSEELQRPVMLKILAARYPAGSRTARRFIRGGKLAVSLEHKSIVRTFSSGVDRGRPYMLMEYLDGHSLDKILKVRDRLAPEMATGIVRQVAKALEVAQARRIAHRGIEPSHIMLSPGGRATVLGFGLARLSEPGDANITAEGALVNISLYSPPEVGMGVLDTRGDLYSLGCVYYHLLAGRPPFQGRDPLELLHSHRTEDEWPVQDLVPGLNEGVGQIVHRLLRKDPTERIQSPTDLISLLDAAVSPEILGAQGIKPDTTLVHSTMEMLALRQTFRVLVCEGQDYVSKLLCETLRRLGVQALAARSGRAALDALKERGADLILTDLKLPGLGGSQLLDAIQEAAPGTAVMLTRAGSEAEAVLAKARYHIQRCFDRPVDIFELREAVRGLVQSHGKES